MPYKPPMCPAYTQSQCLTLSPIPESRGGTGTFNSPVLSHDHDSSNCSIFASFDWSASGANSFSPLMTSASCLSPLSVPSSVSSPAILGRFEQLSLEQMLRCTNPDQQYQQATLSRKTVSMLEAACDARAGYLALGVSSIAAGKTDLTSLTTPTNTPARSNVKQPIQFTGLTTKRKYNRRRQADYDSEEEESDSESDEEVTEVRHVMQPGKFVAPPTVSEKTMRSIRELRQGQQGTRRVAGRFDTANSWAAEDQDCDVAQDPTDDDVDEEVQDTHETAKIAYSEEQEDYDSAEGETDHESDEEISQPPRPTNMMPTLSAKTWRLLIEMRQQGSRRVARQFEGNKTGTGVQNQEGAAGEGSTAGDDEKMQDAVQNMIPAEQDAVAPVPSWLATRIEESQRREASEKDAADVLMDTAGLPASSSDDVDLDDYDSSEGEEYPEIEEVSEMDSDAESLFTAEEGTYAEVDGVGPTASEMAVLAQCKRISVQDSLVIATLKRRSRIMDLSTAFDLDTPKASRLSAHKANPTRCEDNAPAVPPKDALPEEQDITEVAMQEDRSSDIHGIFSPTSRLPMRRSVSFAKPEVTQVKTITGSPLAPKTHKRKASATSLFTATSLSETLSNATSLKKLERRTGRAMSASVASEADKAINSSSSQMMGHKRARRSSTLTSSLAFTSNSLTPIFSSAFLRGLNGKNGTTDRQVAAGVSSDPFSHDANVTLGTLKGALSTEVKQQDLLAEFGLLEDKENVPQGQQGLASRPFTGSAPKSQTMNKKRSFGRTLSLLGRSHVSV